jgi:hypothetical protein
MFGVAGADRSVHIFDTRKWAARGHWSSCLKYSVTSLHFAQSSDACYVGGLDSEVRAYIVRILAHSPFSSFCAANGAARVQVVTMMASGLTVGGLASQRHVLVLLYSNAVTLTGLYRVHITETTTSLAAPTEEVCTLLLTVLVSSPHQKALLRLLR